MSVDYHIHLEEDDWPGPCRYDVHRIGEYVNIARVRGLQEIGISEHCHRFREFKPVMNHLLEPEPAVGAFWLPDQFKESLDDYVLAVERAKAAGLPVKLGIEVDYLPGFEEQIKAILSPYPWDYIIGSVHFLDRWAIDVDPTLGWPEMDVNQAYIMYFDHLEAAIGSGLFDIVAHPDLIKKFGYRPSFDLMPLYRNLSRLLQSAGVAMELSSAGWRKPIGEQYPAAELIALCLQAGVPLTLGSDAHNPNDVGRDFDRLKRLAIDCGYRQIAVFQQREMRLINLA